MYTSNFASVKKLPAELAPVSIARGNPGWYKGTIYLPLAPSWEMVKRMTWSQYNLAYNNILSKLSPEKVYKDLGDNAVMLCWEKIPGKVPCHRRLVAEWLEKALGIEIPEYGLTRKQTPAYPEKELLEAEKLPL
jgi:hypothetical protein